MSTAVARYSLSHSATPERETQVVAQEPGGRLLESGAADGHRPESEADGGSASGKVWGGFRATAGF